jgi:hypothetical protein
MLSGVTAGAQRNRVAIARLEPDATIVPVRTCAASDGAALPQATQESCRTKARCRTRLRKLSLGLFRDRVRGIRGVGIGVRNCRRVGFSRSTSSESGH